MGEGGRGKEGGTFSIASRTRGAVMRPLRKRLLIRSALVAPLDRQAIFVAVDVKGGLANWGVVETV